MLRPTIARPGLPWSGGDAVHATLAAGAAGPVGGDELDLTIRVGTGSTLVLTEVSHTLLLPGRDAARSQTRVHVEVGDHATLVWLPEPLIAARGCDHVNDVEVLLHPRSRLLLREEALLGRHGEAPGRLRQRLRVSREGLPVFHQDLRVGTPTSRAPSVMAGCRAVGSLLVVDGTVPLRIGRETRERAPSLLVGDQAAVLPLATGGALVSAVADGNLQLRAALEAGLEAWGCTEQPGECAATSAGVDWSGDRPERGSAT